MKTEIRRLVLLLPVYFAGPVSAALPPCLDGYTLYSHSRTQLGAEAYLVSGKSGSNGHTELGTGGKSWGDFVSRGNILLRDRSRVFGNVRAGGKVTLLSGALVTGAISKRVSLPVCTIPSETFSAGTSIHNVRPGITLDLPPGAYGDVAVFGNGILRLHGGTYFFKSLTTKADGRIQLDPETGTIQVYAKAGLDIGDRSRFDFTGMDAPWKVKFHSQQSARLALGTDIHFKGTLVAPLADIHVRSRTRILGSLYGKSIVCEPDVVFSGFPFESESDRVEITSPADGFLTNQPSIRIDWTVNGEAQTALTTETLAAEGANTVKRCSGTSCDSILVIRDRTPPIVSILSPSPERVFSASSIAVSWSVDGLEQTTETVENLAFEGANTLTRTATDAAGNSGSASVQVIRDTQAPIVVITSPANGDSTAEADVRVEYTVDGMAQDAFTYTLLEGVNSIIAARTDEAGNTGADTVLIFHQPCRFVADEIVHYTRPENQICLVVQNGGRVFAHKKLTVGSIRIEQGGQLITDDTLQAGKVDIRAGGLVTHSGFTVTDTGYRVHIRAASITLDSAADINVTGKGYPAGRGPEGQVSTAANRGGVHAGAGNSSEFAMYGNHLAPAQAGSGGGNANDTVSGGARGGGVIRLEADTLALRGRIQADGNPIFRGSGAGGSVWINAGILTGAGTVTARGGMGGYYGGGGRIAFSADSLPDDLVRKVSAKGYGGGTIYLEDRRGVHVLRIDSSFTGSTTITSPLSDSLLSVRMANAASVYFTGDCRIGDLAWETPSANAYFPGKLDARTVFQTGGVFEIADTSRIDTLGMEGTSKMGHPAGKLDQVNKVHVIADYIRISPSSRIDVSGRGYPIGAGPDGEISNRGQGGSHGGLGGSAFFPTYGSLTSPYTPGSGGHIYNSPFGGAGGGIVRLEAGRIELHGEILANGGGSTYGAGAGGSVWVTADTVSGTGRIAAKGGTGLRGGGGRVAVYSCEVSEATRTTIEVDGHQAGTIHLPCHNGPMEAMRFPSDDSYFNFNPLSTQGSEDAAFRTAQSPAGCEKGPSDMDYTPQVKWEWRDAYEPSTGVHVTPMVANINDDNGDGRIDADDVPDIVVAAAGNADAGRYTLAVDGGTGRTLWKVPTDHDGKTDPAVGDIDGEGRPEIIVVQCDRYCWNSRLLVLDNAGEIKSTGVWMASDGVSPALGRISLSDLDGDGKTEILWGGNAYDHLARLVHPNVFGEAIDLPVAQDESPQGEGRRIHSGTVFDFNGDGVPEAVLMAMDTLYIVGADGSTLARYALPSGGRGGKAVIADVDKDGKADIVTGIANPGYGSSGLMVFSNPTWAGACGIHNQLDYTVADVEDDGRISRFPPPPRKARTTAHGQCAVGNDACADISATFP